MKKLENIIGIALLLVIIGWVGYTIWLCFYLANPQNSTP